MSRATRLCLMALFAAGAGAEEPLPARVAKAIDRGVEWLRKQQRPDGSWGPMIPSGVTYAGRGRGYNFPAGPTALSLLTLLKCGVPKDDRGIVRGFAFMDKNERIPTTSYEISALVLALEARANPFKRDRKREETLRRREASPKVKLSPRHRKWMRQLVTALEKRATKGGWRYGGGVPDVGSAQDISSTQLAMMALRVARRAGVKVSKRLVRDAVGYALAQQESDGGWAYIRGSQQGYQGLTSGTMTTGGIVILLSALEVLGPKTKYAARIENAVKDGLTWLEKNWTVKKNPAAAYAPYHYMYLYGLERVGDMMRVRLIGGHDWYREGAEVLLKGQRRDGSWWVRDTHEPRDIINTCFALLFLDRATLPGITPSK